MNPAGLQSWGNYPRFPQTGTPCFWPADLASGLDSLQRLHGTTLAFGAGRSYGDVCLAASDRVLPTRALNRLIAADWSTGVIVAECGLTLGELLAVAIPKGWFVPVTPGTRQVTLGGAVANDVHGKNHHRRGTFGAHVRRLGLLRSDTGEQICSVTENPSLFSATLGGLGLTGLIQWVELQLVPIRSSRLVTVTQRFDSLEEGLALTDELERQHEFCVAWLDCRAHGGRLGRGVYSAGNFAAEGPLEAPPRRQVTVPFTPPCSLVNRASQAVLNTLYWRRAPAHRRQAVMDFDAFFYPLDAIGQWNRLYGPNGFLQYQALIPAGAAVDGIHEMLRVVSRAGVVTALAVLKRFADHTAPGLLSFAAAGTTLALDFPYSSRLVSRVLPSLDAIVRAADGRLYPAKDSHMTGEDFRRGYPGWQRLEALRDPALLSRFWQRVTR